MTDIINEMTHPMIKEMEESMIQAQVELKESEQRVEELEENIKDLEGQAEDKIYYVEEQEKAIRDVINGTELEKGEKSLKELLKEAKDNIGGVNINADIDVFDLIDDILDLEPKTIWKTEYEKTVYRDVVVKVIPDEVKEAVNDLVEIINK